MMWISEPAMAACAQWQIDVQEDMRPSHEEMGESSLGRGCPAPCVSYTASLSHASGGKTTKRLRRQVLGEAVAR